MYTILSSRLKGMKEEMRDFLVKLVETPSPSGQEEKIADIIFEEMNMLGFDKVCRDNAGNVTGVVYGIEDGPTVMLNSHIDTVPVPENAANWDTPPLKASFSGTRLQGLGAADCKGGLAAQIYAVELLKRSLLPLKGNIIVAATVSEENGCSVGVKSLMRETLPSLELNPDYVILGEPTDLGVYYGHNGRVELDIKIEGNNPFMVDDSAKNICKGLGRGREDGKLADANGISFKAPEFGSAHGKRQASICLEKKLYCGEQVEAVTEWFKHEAGLLLSSEKALALEVQVAQDERVSHSGKRTLVKRLSSAWQTDPFDPLMERSRQSLAAAGCKVKTGKWKLDQPGMGTAGGVICNEFNIPVIGYGPGEEEQAHKPNESLDMEKVYECAFGTAAIAHGLVGIPVFGWTSDEI